MRMILLAAIAALSFSVAASAADGYKLDAKGKCHDAHGKFAKDALCKPAEVLTYKLDSKGKCHDSHGRFANADKCKH